VPAPLLLGDAEVLQVTGWVRGPGGGMENPQMREPGLIYLFSDESMHRRARLAKRGPRSLGVLRREDGPEKVR
jgi:hypothetical protein